MQYEPDKECDGELVFYKEVEGVNPGDYQYKYRLGPGDWWVCDDSAETGQCLDTTELDVLAEFVYSDG